MVDEPFWIGVRSSLWMLKAASTSATDWKESRLTRVVSEEREKELDEIDSGGQNRREMHISACAAWRTSYGLAGRH
jgi:hypothetical protein